MSTPAQCVAIGRGIAERPVEDLREYIDRLEMIGELQRIDAEVSLDLEVGAVIRRSYELKAPAPLFGNIAGVERGFRVLGAPAGVSRQRGLSLARVALALGLDPRSTGRDIVEHLAAARSRRGIPPRVMAEALCKENIVIGKDVDLTRLPAPLLHGGADGRRFLNTFGTIIASTPDRRWTNWSIARMMIVDAKRMSCVVAPSKHLGRVHAIWKARGRDMPFALALGVPPAIPFVAGMPLPAWTDEADAVGAYQGEGVKIVACETNDLFVPAASEVVLEGRLSRSDKVTEGPISECTGYSWRGLSAPEPAYYVDAMTYRTNPILPVVLAGEPVEEDHMAWGIPNAAEVLYQLRKANIPVTMCWPTLEAANHWLIVTLRRRWRSRTGMNSDGICRRIGEIIFGDFLGRSLCKVLVFEDDIDPTNTNEVVWAYATRCHPGTGEILMSDETNAALSIYPDEDEHRMTATKAVYNCLTRDEGTGSHSSNGISLRRGYPEAVQQQVLSRWSEYGYADEGGLLVRDPLGF